MLQLGHMTRSVAKVKMEDGSISKTAVDTVVVIFIPAAGPSSHRQIIAEIDQQSVTQCDAVSHSVTPPEHNSIAMHTGQLECLVHGSSECEPITTRTELNIPHTLAVNTDKLTCS